MPFVVIHQCSNVVGANVVGASFVGTSVGETVGRDGLDCFIGSDVGLKDPQTVGDIKSRHRLVRKCVACGT